MPLVFAWSRRSIAVSGVWVVALVVSPAGPGCSLDSGLQELDGTGSTTLEITGTDGNAEATDAATGVVDSTADPGTSGTGLPTAMTTGDSGTDTGGAEGAGDLYCFDEFGPQLSIFTLTRGPATVETFDFGSYVPLALAVSPEFPMMLGAIPENGDAAGLFWYEDLADIASGADPGVFIPLEGPNQVDDGCVVPNGVLLTSDTAPSVVCSPDSADCIDVTSPQVLGACECAGSTCIASSPMAGLLESVDGGLTFIEQGNDFRASQIAGNGQGAMYFHDMFNGVGRFTTDSGASYSETTAPRGADDIEALLVDAEFALGARPFEPDVAYVSPLPLGAFEAFSVGTGVTVVQGFQIGEADYLLRTAEGSFWRSRTLSGGWEEIRVTQEFAARCAATLVLQR